MFAAVALSASFFAVRFYERLHPVAAVQGASVTASSSQPTDAELAKIRADFEKVAEVPAGEEPSVGQVVDVGALQKQNPTFYADAQNGDALFIYQKIAFIFRPSTDKIVNIAPVNRTDAAK